MNRVGVEGSMVAAVDLHWPGGAQGGCTLNSEEPRFWDLLSTHYLTLGMQIAPRFTSGLWLEEMES